MKLLPTRRTVKRWGIGLGILLGVLLLVNGFFSWQTNRRFNAKIEAIRAAGYPASIADLKPKSIPAELNAAAHLDALAPRLDEFAKEQYRWERKTPLGKTYEDLPEGTRPNAEQLAAMRAILDNYADLEAAVAAAAACPQYASTADFSLHFNEFLEKNIDSVKNIRATTRLIRWRAGVLIGENRPDLAVERWLEVLRLAKLHEAEPTLMAQLVTFAVRGATIGGLHEALTAGSIPPELRDRLDAELARVENPSKMRDILIGERGVSVSAGIDQTSGINPEVPRPIVWLVGWPVKRFFTGPLAFYEELLPIADIPWPEFKRHFADGGKFDRPSEHGVLADLLVPALEAGFVTAHRDTAYVRSLRVFNALQRYADENGREAAALADLDLPKEATIDPFSEKPLIIRRTDAGWLVYSVGVNGIDDGGKIHDREQSDVGLGPPQSAEAGSTQN
jgi:hypothetical protein